MNLQFSEKVLFNHPRGPMEVRHLILKGSNYDIGRKLGEIARERHGIQRTSGADRLRTHSQRAYMQRNYPIYYQRMLGIADTYGMNIEEDASDFSVLGKPELGTGCSAVYYPPGRTSTGHGMVSRNLDFFTGTGLGEALGFGLGEEETPPFARPYMVELHPDQGYPSLFIMSFELLGEALEGINSQGLAVIHLADDESPAQFPMEPVQGNAVGLNELKSIQLLLDTCANVVEAKHALLTNKHYYALNPVHLLVADRHGDSFVWEYSHAHNREYIIDGSNSPLVVTNFLLHRYQSPADIPRVSEDQGCFYNRYRTLSDLIERNKENFTPEFIKAVNTHVFLDATLSQSPCPFPYHCEPLCITFITWTRGVWR